MQQRRKSHRAYHKSTSAASPAISPQITTAAPPRSPMISPPMTGTHTSPSTPRRTSPGRVQASEMSVLLRLFDEIDGRLVNNACGFHRLLQIGRGAKRLCHFEVLVIH